MNTTYTTQAQVRQAFWDYHPNVRRIYIVAKASGIRCTAPQNSQPADTRMAFVDFVDSLTRSGEISERLAERVTL